MRLDLEFEKVSMEFWIGLRLGYLLRGNKDAILGFVFGVIYKELRSRVQIRVLRVSAAMEFQFQSKPNGDTLVIKRLE
jgi:hypothetical protein